MFTFYIVVFSQKLGDPLLPIICKNETIEKPFQKLVALITIYSVRWVTDLLGFLLREVYKCLITVLFCTLKIVKQNKTITNVGLDLVLKIAGELPALPWKTALGC